MAWAFYETEYQEGDEKLKVRNHEENLHSYVVGVEERLGKIYGEKSDLVSQWQNYGKYLKKMFDIPANRWGFLNENGPW